MNKLKLTTLIIIVGIPLYLLTIPFIIVFMPIGLLVKNTEKKTMVQPFF